MVFGYVAIHPPKSRCHPSQPPLTVMTGAGAGEESREEVGRRAYHHRWIYWKLLREVLSSIREQWAISDGYIWSNIEWMWMMTADERVESHLAIALLMMKLAEESSYIRSQAGPQGWRQRDQQHSGSEMLTNGTKMPVIDGSVTIMLIGSIRGIKIWHQNAFRSVVPVLSPSGRSAGISMRISKWVPVLPCQWFSRLSKLKNIFVSLWPFECMLTASSSLWQMQRFNIWQDNSLLSTKSVIYKRKRCFINTMGNCVLIGVLFPNNFQVWANLLSKMVCEEAIVK